MLSQDPFDEEADEIGRGRGRRGKSMTGYWRQKRRRR